MRGKKSPTLGRQCQLREYIRELSAPIKKFNLGKEQVFFLLTEKSWKHQRSSWRRRTLTGTKKKAIYPTIEVMHCPFFFQ